MGWLLKVDKDLKSSKKNYSYYFQNEIFKLTKESKYTRILIVLYIFVDINIFC